MAERIVTSAFADGVLTYSVKDAGEVGFTLTKASPAVRARAEVHGWMARIGDMAALGKDATPADKLAALRRGVEHYESGTDSWELERAGGGPGLDSLALAAVVEATMRGEAEVRALIEVGSRDAGMTPRAYLSHLAAADKVIPILKRLREAAAPKAPAANDMLAAMVKGGPAPSPAERRRVPHT